MKFSHGVEISIISVFQYYSTIKTYCKVHGIDLISVVHLCYYSFWKNYQNLVKTTSFERYFQKGALLFSRGVQNFKLAGAKSVQGGEKQVQGVSPALLRKKASGRKAK